MAGVRVYLKNAAILTVTGLGLRAAGMVLRVYMAALLGAEGMGLHQLIFTVYGLTTTVATAGMSVAATRLAAEELARLEAPRAAGMMAKLTRLSLALGFAACAAQLLLARPVARFALGDARAELGLLVLAPSLPFMALAAVFKGYFFARQRVGPGVKSQVFEQTVRIALAAAVLPAAGGWGAQYACAALVAGNTVSEALACLLLLHDYRKDARRLFGGVRPAPPADAGRRIWHILAPVEGGRCLDSALHTAENMLVPACLLAFLGSRAESLAQFGALKGMAMPVLLFPFSFLTPLATLLLPEVTRAHILGRRRTLETLVGRIMLFTNLFSVLAGGLIALNAAPLARLLYRDESVGLYLLVLAPVLPGMYLDAMGDSILKGLGEEVATFRYSIWDSMLRIALVLLLMPHFGMTGFLVVMWASNVTSALLNIFRIHKVTGIRTRWFEWFIQPTLLFAAAAALGQTFVRLVAPEGDVWQVACSIAATGGLFCAFLLPLGAGRQLKAVLDARRAPAKEN